MTSPDHRWFWVAYATLGGAVAALLFGPKYLPLTDLPQHAAQLALWVHWDDSAWDVRRLHELNWGTPYLLAYSLARLFVPALGVVGALKAVLLLATLALPLAISRLLRGSGIDRSLALLGFPLSWGFAFWFGFVNFVITVPLGIALLAAVVDRTREPTRRDVLVLTLAATGVYFAHVLVAAFVAPAALAVTWARGGSWRKRVLGGAIFLPAALAFSGWGITSRARIAGDASTAWEWKLSRLWEFPAWQLAMGTEDVALWGVGVALLLVPFAIGLRPAVARWRLLPLGVVLALTLAAPFKLAGVAFLHQRFAVFLAPALLLSLRPGAARLSRPMARVVIGALIASWFAIVIPRLVAFDREARAVDAVLAAMEPQSSVRPVIVDRGSEHLPGGAPYLHFAAYHQAERGGFNGFSFARSPTSFVRYRAGVDPGMPRDAEWRPQDFDWKREGERYDYFFMRSAVDPRLLFFDDDGQVQLIAHSGPFWLFRPSAP